MDKDELKKFEKIKSLTETEGGKYIQDTAKEVVVNTVHILANSYSEKTHTDLISLCAKLSSNLSMYQLLTGIEDQIEAIKSLYQDKKQN